MSPRIRNLIALAALASFVAAVPVAEAAQRHHRYRYKKKVVTRVVKPPVRHRGTVKIVTALPAAPRTVVVGGKRHFYASGIFYEKHPRGYVIVRAPIGARVGVLPPGHLRVVLGGTVYFNYYGTYYQLDPARGDYVVVTPLRAASGDEDVVLLVDGETMAGRLLASDGDTIDFLVDGEVYEVPLADVVSITFAPASG